MTNPRNPGFSKVDRILIAPDVIRITRWYAPSLKRKPVSRKYKTTPARVARLSLDTIRKAVKAG